MYLRTIWYSGGGAASQSRQQVDSLSTEARLGHGEGKRIAKAVSCSLSLKAIPNQDEAAFPLAFHSAGSTERKNIPTLNLSPSFHHL